MDNIIGTFNKCLELRKTRQVIEIWKNLGYFFWQTGEWGKIYFYGNKAYNLTKRYKEYYGHIMYVIDSLGRFFYFTNNFETSYKFTREALNIAKKNKDQYSIAFFESRLGKIYQYPLKLDLSLKLLTESLSVLKKYNDKESIAFTYKFIGETFIYKKDMKNSLLNFQKALKYFKQIKDYVFLAIIMSSLGSLYYHKNQYAKARNYLLKAMHLEKRYSVRVGIRLFCSLAMALIEKRQGKMGKSIEYLNEAKKENNYLNISKDADKIFAIGFLLKKDLQNAGYYIFE